MLKLFAALCALGFLAACNSSPENTTVTDLDTITKTSADTTPPPPPALQVSAHLIYDDGTLSSFDVLNNDTIALWNTIIGEGSAEKASERTRISMSGDLANVNVLIKNGDTKAVDTTVRSGRQFNYTLNNTGCSEVYVTVKKNRTILYKDTIPFQCGE